jgi:hypothetical protein
MMEIETLQIENSSFCLYGVTQVGASEHTTFAQFPFALFLRVPLTDHLSLA